jgi:hypothetical protein
MMTFSDRRPAGAMAIGQTRDGARGDAQRGRGRSS